MFESRSKKPQILYLARKDCTALGPGSEGNELGLLHTYFSLRPFRMRFALFLFFIGRFGWTSPFFPNSKKKAVSHRDVDSFSALNEMGNFEPPI